MFITDMVGMAADIFSQAVDIKDYQTSLINGEFEDTFIEQRAIFGVIQPASELNIAIETDGAESKGFMLLHTKDIVHAYDNTQTSESFLQSYVIYEGNFWKVNKREDWRDKTCGYNKYVLEKYVNTDSGVS